MDYQQFKKIPSQLRYGEKLPLEENKEVEFKAVQETKKPLEVIQKYLKDYLNAFLNSHGGSIWFGIEDDGTIRGLYLTLKERDECRLSIDTLCNTFVPQVDNSLTRLDLIPVNMLINEIDQTRFQPTDIDQSTGFTCKAVAVHSQKPLERVVVVASILPGISPVYFTSKLHDMAWMRRDGGIVKMSQDVIVQRITQGRRIEQSEKFEESSFLGRRELIQQCMRFFAGNEAPTKVLVLYGLISVGKSHLCEYLRQKIVSDRKLFSICPQIFQVDMKGTVERHTSLNDALIQLIRSMRPQYDLSFISTDEPSTSYTSNTASTRMITNFSFGPSVFTQDFDSPLASSGVKTNKYTQQLLNIYQNIINELPFSVIILENVGKPQVAAKLIPAGANSIVIQLWEVELLFLVYYVSNYILKYFATSNADDKFQQIISSWRLFMNYSLTQEGQKYDFDRIRPQSTIQSRYLIFQKGKQKLPHAIKGRQ
ncbi:AAA-4_domain protein [Hexamita inflata]|uniref:AAA-4 domain protein n=1 Tax=Hexamita inflata TaxID=28002 RepID=A0AA86RHT8_9EUKA|nr:AAA-4 domain protein [Hexamita inflata]CAI9975038.1 AAA-4 domain protein [Hexamita inflata]